MNSPDPAFIPLIAQRRKRADQIASAIETDILANRWAVGQRIGNEAELAEVYGVSRWTLREAVAILEQGGTIVTRRGAGGGLFLAAPAPDLVRNSLGAYLESSIHHFECIAQTRLALTRAATLAITTGMTEKDRIALAALVLRAERGGTEAIEAASAARQRLRDLVGNRPLSLFLGVLADFGMHSAWMSALDDDTFVALIDRQAIAVRRHCLAVMANDVEAAMRAEVEALGIARELYAASSLSGRFRSSPNAFERAYALYASSRPAKKAERVAWAVRRQIVDEQMNPGTNLGSEELLMQRHAVGRPVLREAIRILERLGIVEMRPGRASGLTVIAPEPASVVSLARQYLRSQSSTAAECAQVAAVLRPIERGNAVAGLMLAIVED
jgi:DNA-binding FadR family transcriptional regulator